jgi:hypothetical protein
LRQKRHKLALLSIFKEKSHEHNIHKEQIKGYVNKYQQIIFQIERRLLHVFHIIEDVTAYHTSQLVLRLSLDGPS